MINIARLSVHATLVASAFLFAPTTGKADDSPGDDPVLREIADLGGYVMFFESGAPGMVLGLVRGDASLVTGYGETEAGNGQVPDGRSLMRMNSITKVFAGEVVASLVADRRLSLTDTLESVVPDLKVPTFEGRQITVLDLATHTSALPREMGVAPEDAAPRTWPDRAAWAAWLPNYELPWAPGGVASYSNIGFDLLAAAAESAGGAPYADLLRERVTGPLGMVDTGFTPNPEQCARLMVGTGIGGAGPCVDTRATQGSGGLYSTGNDMVRWLRHNLDAGNQVLALSHAPYRFRQALPAAIGFDEAGPMSGLGLGWVIMAADSVRPTIVAKSGGGIGFMSYIAFAPGRDVGVFVAVNRTDFAMFTVLTTMANDMIASLATR